MSGLGRRRWFGLGVVIAAAICATLIPRLEIDNRLERWAGRDAEQQEVYERFRATFGSDEFVLVAVGGAPLFEDEALGVMVDVAARLEQVPGVERVQGIPVVFRDLFGGEDVEELEEEMTSTPFYTDLFVSDDGDMAGILVVVTPPAEPGGRRRLVDGIERAVSGLEDHGFDVAVVGSTALIVALDELSAGETQRTLPVALICSLVVLAVVLRSVRAMIVAASCSALSLLLLAGVVVLSGRSLNMITSVLPSLLWVLALSNIVHIIQRYRHNLADQEPGSALAGALRETTRPCVLAAVTTAVGFSSLLVASMEPVRELGAFAAVGILLSLAVNLSVGPVLLAWIGAPARGAEAPGRRRWHGAVIRPGWVAAAAAGAVGVSALCVPFIRVESNPLSFLPHEDPTAAAYSTVGEGLTGFYTMEIVVHTPEVWWEPAVWPTLEGIQERLERSSVVARVLGPLDILRKLHQWEHGFDPQEYRLPASAEEAEDLLAGLDVTGREQLAALAGESGHAVRVSAIVDEMDQGLFLELVESTRDVLGELPEGFEAEVTGQVLQLVEAQQRLVATQVRSLGLALVVVFACIGVGLRSVRYSVASLLPNMLPVLAAFTVMAVARIPLDTATVMMASVALGIAVDNTLHLLTVHDEQRRRGSKPESAAAAAVARVASPAIVTTATASAGFVALLWSAFPPIRYLGLLSVVAMAVALLGDLVVLPALLVITDRRRAG